MKVKRVKQAKRIVAFYQQNFGLRQPYQVLIDGSFAHAALKMKINIREQLPRYLGGEVQCLTSRCACLELRTLGSAGHGALQILNQYDERHCGHTVAKAKPTPDCITSLIGEDNRHHYVVATQDANLRQRLRQVPGVPLLLITHNSIVLEKAADASLQKAEKIVQSKLAGSAAEKESLRRMQPEGGATEGPVSRKRKRVGPNPLSCQKKKPKPLPEPAQTPTSSEAALKTRKRVRPSRRKEASDSTTTTVAASAAD